MIAEAKNDRLYDKRTIDRTIKKGLITRKDYDNKGVFGGPQDDDLDDDDLDETDAAE